MSRSVLLATAELAPLARVGGLAEATSGLVRALRSQGVDVTVALPDYGDVRGKAKKSWKLATPEWCGQTTARLVGTDAGDVVLVSAPGMARPHPYVDPETGDGWPDNDHRFMAFSAGVAALSQELDPDVLHLNDWHTAATVGFVESLPPTVLTIHTLGYQGVTDAAWMQRIPHRSERFAWFDVANPLVGAIRTVDRIIAVSPNYAAEILQPQTGMGMHEELAARGDALVGIRNGIDAETWNPAVDPLIPRTYDRSTIGDGKLAARTRLMEQAGWVDDHRPLLSVVTRLVDQKGVDFVAGLVSFLDGIDARLFLLGSGLPHLQTLIENAAAEYPDRVFAVTDRYDEPLAHLLFAGSDAFVMPSRFEPCGLAQMQAMAYGTLPIVTAVGGLIDTVIDADADPIRGTGIVTTTNDLAGLVDATHRMTRLLTNPARRGTAQRAGMDTDWSWTEPASRHMELYDEITDPDITDPDITDPDIT